MMAMRRVLEDARERGAQDGKDTVVSFESSEV